MLKKLPQNLLSLLNLEIRMILRNKKPLNNLYQILIIYILSVLAFNYTQNNPFNNSLFFFMVVSLLSSSFILGHGIFMLTWESTYFSFLLTRKISINNFFRAKLCLFIISSILFSFISVPIIIICGGNVLLYLSFLIFNIGLIPILLESVSFFNNERASLDRGIFFNYEGYGLWQYLLFVSELMLPGIIYIVVSKYWSTSVALLTLFIIGSVGMILLIFYPRLFFNKKKYNIIQGFNQK